MVWRPRGTAHEREAWAEAHPWRAGVWAGGLFGAVMAALGALLNPNVLTLTIVGTFTGLVFGVSMALAFKHRWGRRWMRDAPEDVPFHPWTRPWSQASDRFVTRTLIWAIVGLAFSLVDFVMSGGSLELITVSGLASFWLLVVGVRERLLRRAGG